MTLKEILQIDDSYDKYKNISEATNMDINTFYESYRDYDESLLTSSCPAILKTPENIWPSEYRNP
ncbi:MAG TPA: hypothetical protein DHW49_09405 [Anaerolineae bacterium]|nr:hypothetical protein [Anaerolineae bacterium]